MTVPRVRKSIRDLEAAYSQGDKAELETLIRAFAGIQKLQPDDPNSFFKIAGYHGEPFRGAGWGNPQWWGGFCAHGNVLFPTWHRAYLLRLEDALRSIKGCENFALPYWNELDEATQQNGIPPTFLKKTFTLDGKDIPNPLYAYKFQKGVWDNLSGSGDFDYSKPPDYVTVRHPFSGLVDPKHIEGTEAYNAQLESRGEAFVNAQLNENVQNWLMGAGLPPQNGTRDKYHRSLTAPNYTVFSNTTSATQWNEDSFNYDPNWRPRGDRAIPPEVVVPLESPHNEIHLAIGGFTSGADPDKVTGSNGDMGENDTAAFDPIFFFHHCFVDYVFWQWQQKHNSTKELEIIPEYPGTNSVDSQGPPAGMSANVWLDLNTPLDPFKNPDGKAYTSKDLINIEEQIGYTYAPSTASGPSPGAGLLPPSIPQQPLGTTTSLTTYANYTPQPLRTLRVTGIDRARIAGSFVVSVSATVNGEEKIIGREAVLSRRHVQGCQNCQTHLNVKTFFPVAGIHPDGDAAGDGAREETRYTVATITRELPRGNDRLLLPSPPTAQISLGYTHGRSRGL